MRNSATASTGTRRANPPSTRFTVRAPSTRKLFDSGRAPLTEYAWPARSEPPDLTTPEVGGATPDWSRPSCEKLRPFSGSSIISRSLTTRPRLESAVLTSGAAASTTTVSLSEAICSRISSRAISPTAISMGRWIVRANPSASTVISYAPTGSNGKRKAPWPVARCSTEKPVAVCVARTEAPGTAASAGSRTRPSITPIGSWQRPMEAERKRKRMQFRTGAYNPTQRDLKFASNELKDTEAK